MKKYNITVNGTTYEVIVEEAGTVTSAPTYIPTTAPVAAPAPQAPAPKASVPTTAGSSTVTAPMPGTILDVKVSVGQPIKKGDIICVLEAMKMGNDIPSPQSGVVASINVQKGSNVNANDIIITLN
jgi:biotin carboxyl carrier protein